MIDFNRFELLKTIEDFNFQVLKPISETNNYVNRNGKSLLFSTINIKPEYQISVRIQEVEYGLSYKVVLESICKDIDIEDYEMDEIIKEVNLISYQMIDTLCNTKEIKLMLAEEGKQIVIDTLVIPRNIEIMANDDILRSKIKILYLDLIPTEIEYPNYVESLLLLGNIGKQVSEILYEIGIARYVRTRGTYLLIFNDEKVSLSNRFIGDFKKGLSRMGVPVFSAFIDFIDHLW